MKKATLIMVLFAAISCSSKKSVPALSATLTSICPKDGNCKVEVFDNKTIVVNSTETGSLYYELADNPLKKVVKYSYKRKVKGDIQDASYREEIIFEITANKEKLAFHDESLQDAQLLFGRFCYCKGQTGYYKINIGSLSINKNPDTKLTKVDLNFITKKVPQVIDNISFVLQ